jgi:hypothetical protein
MIILLALWVFWFVELSSIPLKLMKAFDFMLDNWFVRNLLRLLNCCKCLGFWSGLIVGFYIHRHIGDALLLAGICSLVAIITSKIYYKLLND